MLCNKLIQIRAPEMLAKALTAAADKRLTSRSDYIRGALLDRLRVDDIEANGGYPSMDPVSITSKEA